jgi:hypothetical protein
VNDFLQHHRDSVIGTLSGFDRLRLRGTARLIANAAGLGAFLSYLGILLKDFGAYVQSVTAQMKQAIVAATAAAARPMLFLKSSSVDKEQLAQEIAGRDRIDSGLIAVFYTLEVCNSFDIHRNRQRQTLDLVPARRKCLHYYHYLIHPLFGFLHVRLQSWFPFNIHICINGREWLSRQMDARGIEYVRRENCFPKIANLGAAQELMSQQLSCDWPSRLDELAATANPAASALFARCPLRYYWSAEQSEWATDVMFESGRRLDELYPGLVQHAMTNLSSREVMRFLGKRVPHVGIGRAFVGEVASDLGQRVEGVRVKHRVNGNWVKMYNKQGSVLRVETVINQPRDLRVYRPKEGDEEGQKKWRYMRKGIADLHRRAVYSQASNERYLTAMASIQEKTPLGQLAADLGEPVKWKGQRHRGLNPLNPEDVALLSAINRGEFVINGFRNRDLRQLLYPGKAPAPTHLRRQSGAITRKLRRLRAHGLIKKLPHTHRYRLTHRGGRIVTAVLAARAADTAKLHAAA